MTAAIPVPDSVERGIDPLALRRAAGRYVTGVGVITSACEDGTPVGATVNAITCLSLDPPLYLACLSNSSNTLKAIRERGVFGVNLLSHGQDHAAMTFASKAADKFAEVPYERTDRGVPLLRDIVAGFECRVEHTYAGGDHTIVVGRVRSIRECDDAPLVMRSGKFVRLTEALS